MRIPHQALRSSITVEDFTGQSSIGQTFGAPRVIRASVQWTESYRMEWKNEMHTVRAWILIRPEAGPVVAGSRVTYNGEVFKVVQSLIIPDERSPSHYELVVSEWGVS